MNESKSKQIINILIVLAVSSTLVLAYYFLFERDASVGEEPSPNIVGDIPTGIDANILRIISLINELNRLNLSNNIVERPDFKSLADITVPIVEESTGVSNPFTGALP